MGVLRVGRFRWAVLLSGFALGCGSDAPPPPSINPPSIDELLRCDITEIDCQEAIYASVAEGLGSDPNVPPAIRTIAVSQYESELRASVGPDDYAAAESVTRGLGLMGLIAEEATSLIDTQIDALVSSVLAYFDPTDGMITVIDRDYEDVEAQVLLAHEFVHAIQDHDFGFDAITAGVEVEDAFIAMRSVIEGDAEHNSITWALERLEMPLTAAEWDAFHEESTAFLRQSVSSPDLSVTAFGSTFPYIYGFEFMSDAILSAGLDVRRELWTAGPMASLDVMSGYAAFRDGVIPARDIPQLAHPAPPPGYVEVVEDELGAWTVFAFLHHFGIGQDLAWEAAVASTGDTFVVYESDSDTAAVWRLRFAPTQLDVASIVAQALELSLRSTAWTSFAEGDDVIIVAAETQMTLDSWLGEPMEPLPLQAAPKAAPRRMHGVLSAGTCVKSRIGARVRRIMEGTAAQPTRATGSFQ